MFLLVILLIFAPLFVIWGTFGPLAYRNKRPGLLLTFIAIGVYIFAMLGFNLLSDVIAEKLRLSGTGSRIASLTGMLCSYGATCLFYFLLKRSWQKERDVNEKLLDS